MEKIVSTKTLFKSNKDYGKLDYKGKREYINNLAKEFMKEANELMESLKNR